MENRATSRISHVKVRRASRALVLILDVRDDGAGRFLKRSEIIKAMETELAKLPPGDEVAIMAMDIGEDERRFWVTEFTNDRAKIASALARIQEMCEKKDDEAPPIANIDRTMQKRSSKPKRSKVKTARP